MTDFELLGREPVPTEEKLIEQQLDDLEAFARRHPREWVVIPADLAAVLDVEQWETHRRRFMCESWRVETDAETGSLVTWFSGG